MRRDPLLNLPVCDGNVHGWPGYDVAQKLPGLGRANINPGADGAAMYWWRISDTHGALLYITTDKVPATTADALARVVAGPFPVLHAELDRIGWPPARRGAPDPRGLFITIGASAGDA